MVGALCHPHGLLSCWLPPLNLQYVSEVGKTRCLSSIIRCIFQNRNSLETSEGPMCPVTGGRPLSGEREPTQVGPGSKGTAPHRLPRFPGPALPCTAPRTGWDSTGKPMHLQEPRQVTLPLSLGQRCSVVSPVLHPTTDALLQKLEKEEKGGGGEPSQH